MQQNCKYGRNTRKSVNQKKCQSRPLLKHGTQEIRIRIRPQHPLLDVKQTKFGRSPG